LTVGRKPNGFVQKRIHLDCGRVGLRAEAREPLRRNHGYEIALKWIESEQENVAVAGWATLSSLVAMKDDDDLDPAGLKRLLRRVQETIHHQPDSVRYAMNGFLIALGTYVQGLSDLAAQAAAKVGQVSVDMGNTACKVPNALEHIHKARERGAIGKKRKTVKC
jgi:hypothetical protein